MASAVDPESRAKGIAYRKALEDKIERREELSLGEKRFLLRTGVLPYKALTFPESLTPAERNRLRFMPPPDEVAASIRRLTNGAMSTPDEVFQKALDDAEAMPHRFSPQEDFSFLHPTVHQGRASSPLSLFLRV